MATASSFSSSSDSVALPYISPTIPWTEEEDESLMKYATSSLTWKQINKKFVNPRRGYDECNQRFRKISNVFQQANQFSVAEKNTIRSFYKADVLSGIVFPRKGNAIAWRNLAEKIQFFIRRLSEDQDMPQVTQIRILRYICTGLQLEKCFDASCVRSTKRKRSLSESKKSETSSAELEPPLENDFKKLKTILVKIDSSSNPWTLDEDAQLIKQGLYVSKGLNRSIEDRRQRWNEIRKAYLRAVKLDEMTVQKIWSLCVKASSDPAFYNHAGFNWAKFSIHIRENENIHVEPCAIEYICTGSVVSMRNPLRIPAPAPITALSNLVSFLTPKKKSEPQSSSALQPLSLPGTLQATEQLSAQQVQASSTTVEDVLPTAVGRNWVEDVFS